MEKHVNQKSLSKQVDKVLVSPQQPRGGHLIPLRQQVLQVRVLLRHLYGKGGQHLLTLRLILKLAFLPQPANQE